MKRLNSFSKSRFLSFSDKKRHKKCMEMIEAYFAENNEAILDHYLELLSWMNQKAPDNLLDAYHKHAIKAETSEKHLVTKKDSNPKAPFLDISIYLENLRSIHNVASIMRTTEALRLGKIYVSGHIDVKDLRLEKVSMDACNWIEKANISSHKELSRPLIAVETIHGAISYRDFCYPETFTLAFGNEAYGLSDALLQDADAVIQIPLFGKKNSLNVSCAFSIIASDIAQKLH